MSTFIFVLGGVCTETLLGIILGLLFWDSSKMPGRRFALTMLFAPMILAPVATAYYYRLMLNRQLWPVGCAIYAGLQLIYSSASFLHGCLS